MLDWNDVRHFLAVMREGNTLAASRALKVSQTTVARRIEALESALGIELFDKRRTGYAPTEVAKALAGAAAHAEEALAAFESHASLMKREQTGTVRVTTSHIMADQLLTPALGRFHEKHPELKLEIVAEDRFVDLAVGGADIALRIVIGEKPQPGLIGRRLTKDSWSVYCSRAYSAAHGTPKNGTELRGHTLIMAEPGRYRVPIADWIYSQVTPAEVAIFRNNVAGMFADIKAGLGISVMSDVLASGEADFVRCFTPDIEQPHELWLLTHERLRNVPRVRTVMDFLADHFSKLPAVRKAKRGRKA